MSPFGSLYIVRPMKEYLPYILIILFLASVSYFFIRAKKGKRILLGYLSEKNVNPIDVRWIISPASRVFVLSPFYLLYEVVTKQGNVKYYMVGSRWSGLFHPEVKEVE